jgi:small subunit ribosomal protein S19e
LIDALSKELKEMPEVLPPTWAPFVKTGVNRELPPESPDWWYIRSAAVLRKVYMRGPLGTRRLKSYFGGRKNRGSKQEKARSGSGSVARKILQQLENARLVETVPNGRQLTAKGMSFVDNVANSVN